MATNSVWHGETMQEMFTKRIFFEGSNVSLYLEQLPDRFD